MKKDFSIAICGAHRVGKSTLALELSSIFDKEYISSSITKLMTEYGVPTDVALKYPKRLDVQNFILEGYDKLFWDKKDFVADRCHFDLLLYTLMEVNNDFPQDKNLSEAFDAYVAKCIQETQKIDALYLLQPGIPIVDASGKGALVKPLIDKLNLIGLGLIQSHGLNFTVIPANLLTKKSRVDFVMNDLRERNFI